MSGQRGEGRWSGSNWKSLSLYTESSVEDASGIKIVTASCKGDQRALGGGALVVAGTATSLQLQVVAIGGTHPTPDLDGWSAMAWEVRDILATWSVTAYVLCATVT